MNDLLGDPPRMRALSLYQPWASAIAAGLKRWETRPWATTVRGEFAVHAGKVPIDMRDPIVEVAIASGLVVDDLPFGAIVALVDLVRCIPGPQAIHEEPDVRQHAWGDFSVGRFALQLENVRPLRGPVPVSGRQGWFFLDDATARTVRSLVGDPLP